MGVTRQRCTPCDSVTALTTAPHSEWKSYVSVTAELLLCLLGLQTAQTPRKHLRSLLPLCWMWLWAAASVPVALQLAVCPPAALEPQMLAAEGISGPEPGSAAGLRHHPGQTLPAVLPSHSSAS